MESQSSEEKKRRLPKLGGVIGRKQRDGARKRDINLSSFKQDRAKEILQKCQGMEQTLKLINSDGSILWKVRSSSKWFRRKFGLDIHAMKIIYSPSSKSECCVGDSTPEIDIADIAEVRKGWKTDIFNKIETDQKKKGKNTVNENCCFSIIYGERKDKTLDLVSASPEYADKWVHALELILAWYESKRLEEGYELWLREKFNDADINKDKCITFRETLKLLSDLNIELDEKTAWNLFDQANTNKTTDNKSREVLDEDEFVAFYFHLLKRPEIDEILKRYVGANGFLSANQLQNFLRKEQGGFENISLEDCVNYIKIYEHSDAKLRSEMGPTGFVNMLVSSEFDIFNYKEHRHVAQNMSQPLSHYFIASSHNTYIAGDQITGKSSVEAFVEALKRGCKCVELDCYDGEDGEPVVWHGGTLMTKISFRSILEDGIKPYAFVVSPYPLVLSLEVHCSPPVRDKMASYFHSILGEYIYTTEVTDDMKYLPSPDQLLRKILIKAKPHFGKKKEKKNTVETKRELSHRNSINKTTVDGGRIISTRTSTVQTRELTTRDSTIVTTMKVQLDPSVVITADTSPYEILSKGLTQGTVEMCDSSESESEDDEEDLANGIDTPDNKATREPLSALVNLITPVKFHSFEESKCTGKCYQMSSCSEANAIKLTKDHLQEFTNYNCRQISRIYPGAKRTFASLIRCNTNFYPNLFWKSGCQLVTLNYQFQDIPNLINFGMFRQNGGCGYVLKPEVLRKENLLGQMGQTPFGNPCKLTIRFISGQHLPKIEGNSEDIVDPYIELRVIEPGEEPSDNDKYTTKKIENNGFNPVWNETHEVLVMNPDLAFLYFRVRDYAQRGADLPLGYYVVPFRAISTGYRHIHLQNQRGDAIPPSTLFVHISIDSQIRLN